MHRRGFKLVTIQQSLITLRRFLAFLSASGRPRVSDIRRTVRTALGLIYAFLSFLVQEEMIPADIVMWKVKLRLPERLPRAMDPEDLRRLL